MADARTVPEAPPVPNHVAIRREDYRPPDWLVPDIALKFTLGIEQTRVQSKLTVTRNPVASGDEAPLLLNGDELKPVGVWSYGDWWSDRTRDGAGLRITLTGVSHEVAIEPEISPPGNT